MDGISILMEGTTYGASFGTKILTETTGDRRSKTYPTFEFRRVSKWIIY